MSSKQSSTSDFLLHPQLQKNSSFVFQLALSQVRIIHDAHYPWFLLIPCINSLREPHQLSLEQQQLLTNESRMLSISIENCFSPDKLNIACIGNMVEQLHMHHIARYTTDIAWPKPVWGFTDALKYTEEALASMINKLKQELLQQTYKKD